MAARCETVEAIPHFPAPEEDAEELEWIRSDGSVYRSLEASCTYCSPVIYEWGMVGGAYRIRRTVGREVRLTPTVPRQRALGWWEALRSGRAV